MALLKSNINTLKLVSRRFTSALYVTGDKAQANFVVLTPYVDFEDRDLNELTENVKARQLRSVNVDKVVKRWNFYKAIDQHKNVLKLTQSEIGKMIANLNSDVEQNRLEIDKLTLHSKLVRDDLKNVKEYAYGIEENAMLGVLGLPNVLHPKTPSSDSLVVHNFMDAPREKTVDHLQIGKELDLFEYVNPMCCFLKSDAAIFEYALSNYFQQSLLRHDFTQFSNADFVKSIVVEGCGTPYLDNQKVLTLSSDADQGINKLHLVGGASLPSFMAYFAKYLLQPSSLPMKLFSFGRSYAPREKPGDLLNLGQQSVNRIFVALPNDDALMDKTFEQLTRNIIEVYEGLGVHFRLVHAPASDLDVSESLRLGIQMLSNHLQTYVEVGHLSIYDNYLSKRLLFTYKEGNDRKFAKVLSGEVLNVHKFLACVLENNYTSKTPLLSDFLLKYL